MTVKLSWNKVKGADGYEVAYRKAGASKWITVKTAGTSYTVKALYVRGKYRFRVRAANDGGKSAWSKAACRYMKRVSHKLSKKKTYVKVTWKKDAGASGYQIRYAANSKMKNARAVTVKGAKKTALKLKNLRKGKRYYIQVRPYKVYKGVKYTGTYSKARSIKR